MSQELEFQKKQPQEAGDKFVSGVSQFIAVASFTFSDVEDSLAEAKDLVSHRWGFRRWAGLGGVRGKSRGGGVLGIELVIPTPHMGFPEVTSSWGVFYSFNDPCTARNFQEPHKVNADQGGFLWQPLVAFAPELLSVPRQSYPAEGY